MGKFVRRRFLTFSGDGAGTSDLKGCKAHRADDLSAGRFCVASCIYDIPAGATSSSFCRSHSRLDKTLRVATVRVSDIHDDPTCQRHFDYWLDYYSEPPARAWKQRVN
jgi:hypothetical protein